MMASAPRWRILETSCAEFVPQSTAMSRLGEVLFKAAFDPGSAEPVSFLRAQRKEALHARAQGGCQNAMEKCDRRDPVNVVVAILGRRALRFPIAQRTRSTARSISGRLKGFVSRCRRGCKNSAARSHSANPFRTRIRARNCGTLNSRLTRSTAESASEPGKIHRCCI